MADFWGWGGGSSKSPVLNYLHTQTKPQAEPSTLQSENPTSLQFSRAEHQSLGCQAPTSTGQSSALPLLMELSILLHEEVWGCWVRSIFFRNS